MVQAIGDALDNVAGARVLHVTSDADHNRIVITLDGAPEAVRETAFCGIQSASELIDLSNHRGVQPRQGAARHSYPPAT